LNPTSKINKKQNAKNPANDWIFVKLLEKIPMAINKKLLDRIKRRPPYKVVVFMILVVKSGYK